MNYLFSNSKRLFSIFPTDATTKYLVFVNILKILIFFDSSSQKQNVAKGYSPQNSSFNFVLLHQRLKS
jgi:hypothetical protein